MNNEEYDVTDDSSVCAFGEVQGRALFADPSTQDDPSWPICDAHNNFAVATPPDIMDSGVLNDYLIGVEAGLQFAYDDSPEGRQSSLDSLEAAEDAEYKGES